MRGKCFRLAFLAASITTAACSSEAPAPEENRPADVATAAPAPVEEAPSARNETEPAAPKRIAAKGRRCGWLHNPTPANWWLVDRDGQWILGTQGKEPVPGMDEMPDMGAVEWVEVNGSYGYGCACMDMEVDPDEGEVLRIANAEPRPIAQCRNDRSLPDPGE